MLTVRFVGFQYLQYYNTLVPGSQKYVRHWQVTSQTKWQSFAMWQSMVIIQLYMTVISKLNIIVESVHGRKKVAVSC